MIVFNENSIVMNEVTHQIQKWEVWFLTPFGIFVDLESAKGLCNLRDLDPELNINPIPVAVADNGRIYEPFFVRR